MSKDFFKIIKTHKYLFYSIFFIGLILTSYFYLTTPVIYSAKGSFRYIEPEGTIKTTKIDTNGTVTYESFTPGDGGLYIPNLIDKDSLKLSYNSGNGIYTIISQSIYSHIPITEINNFLESIIAKNIEFLNEKLSYVNSLEEELKIKILLENPKKSFPIIIKANSLEIIDKRYLILFFGFIFSFFISLTSVIIKERVDEI
ncbi:MULTISPECIES: hypothetical protein [Cetobacterium]|jgi:hypothetical protein|uniref:Polysaccharide chain length determinant N-terminal domain-containing protein n=1 Tax=Candidatus Cetobacterium colombiensis TaxID=3073100 RepID=A0ABU4WAB0_9FUSO|nr:hypothetical protein [Candidatus Cetobacterium colombiensis]MDX8336080.1 hypothetical protein [Candidatus Cetobacterium colombiensis]